MNRGIEAVPAELPFVPFWTTFGDRLTAKGLRFALIGAWPRLAALGALGVFNITAKTSIHNK